MTGTTIYHVTITRATTYEVTADTAEAAIDLALDGEGTEIDGTTLDARADDAACAECERAHGPHYNGPCGHDDRAEVTR